MNDATILKMTDTPLTLEEIAELERLCEARGREIEALRGTEADVLPDGDTYGTYERPKDGWVCFHCGVRFKTFRTAKAHFGEASDRRPQCVQEKLLAEIKKNRWLPIEDAPKDGSIINVGRGGGRLRERYSATARWDQMLDQFTPEWGQFRLPPTHYRSLPSPP